MNCTVLSGHEFAVRSVVVAGGKIVSGSDDTTIKIWEFRKNMQTGACENTLKGHTDWVNSVFVSDGKIVSGSDDYTIKIWDMQTGVCENTLEGHAEGVNSVVVSDGKIVSGSDDKTIRIWDMQTGALEKTLKGHTRSVCSVFVSDGKIVSGSDDNTIKIWDMQTKKCNGTLTCMYPVNSISVCKNKIVSGEWDNIKVWNMDTGKVENTYHNQGSNYAAIITGDNIIYSACNNLIIIKNMKIGVDEKIMVGSGNCLSLFPICGSNGGLVSGTNNNTVDVWTGSDK